MSPEIEGVENKVTRRSSFCLFRVNLQNSAPLDRKRFIQQVAQVGYSDILERTNADYAVFMDRKGRELLCVFNPMHKGQKEVGLLRIQHFLYRRRRVHVLSRGEVQIGPMNGGSDEADLTFNPFYGKRYYREVLAPIFGCGEQCVPAPGNF